MSRPMTCMHVSDSDTMPRILSSKLPANCTTMEIRASMTCFVICSVEHLVHKMLINDWPVEVR